jgi:hypothetical protein
MRCHLLVAKAAVTSVTAGFVARVWRCFTTTMARRPRHDSPDPAHTPFMTGRAPSWQHSGGASVNHFRSREGRRG